jgi:hypothetical protein
MTQQSYPTLGGEAQSWANIQAKCALYDGPSIDLSDIASLSWGRSVETGKQLRIDGSIKSFTRGAGSCEAKIGFYASGLDAFHEALADVCFALGAPFVGAGNEALIRMVHFDIRVQHTPLGASGILQKEVLGASLVKDGGDYAEGVDPDKSDCELIVTSVVSVVNGKRIRLL